MFNNAIEHSKSKNIDIEVVLAKGKLSFSGNRLRHRSTEKYYD